MKTLGRIFCFAVLNFLQLAHVRKWQLHICFGLTWSMPCCTLLQLLEFLVKCRGSGICFGHLFLLCFPSLAQLWRWCWCSNRSKPQGKNKNTCLCVWYLSNYVVVSLEQVTLRSVIKRGPASLQHHKWFYDQLTTFFRKSARLLYRTCYADFSLSHSILNNLYKP